MIGPRPVTLVSERLHGKVAVITGGSRGLGRAAALRFAAEGARVVVADAHEGDEATVQAIRQGGGEAIFVPTDVSDARDAEAMVGAALEHFGHLDVLYCNAAVQLHGQDAPAHELEEAVWERTLAVNLRGVWLCAKYALPALLGRGGSIILAASPTGLTGGGAGYTAYSASKGGVIALTRVMAADYGRSGVRVNAVVPGPTETPLIASLVADEAVRRRLEDATMLGRLGQPEDVTGLLVFLASDEARYCTGGIYMADGGITAL